MWTKRKTESLQRHRYLRSDVTWHTHTQAVERVVSVLLAMCFIHRSTQTPLLCNIHSKEQKSRGREGGCVVGGGGDSKHARV